MCSGNKPSVPCCRKRRVSLRTVSGWVCVSSALRSGATSDEDHRANQLIAPLDVIDKMQLELVKIMYRLHWRFAPLFQTIVGSLQSDERMRRVSLIVSGRFEARWHDAVLGGTESGYCSGA